MDTKLQVHSKCAMKSRIHLLGAIIVLFAASSCRTARTGLAKDDQKLTAVFVQVNDVYEIAPLAGGKFGGMARVATLKKQHLQKNPNTFLVMAGDFVSPSVYSSLTFNGERIRGKQMIEAMNAAGTDFAIFGNHEFDITEKELQQRINESTFQWISSNAFHLQGGNVAPFAKRGTQLSAFPSVHILSLRDNDGTTARIGLIGLVLPFNKAEYVHYTDALTTAKELYNSLKDSVDGVIAITHQSVGEDKILAQELPNLLAIIGGHEHDQIYEKVGNVHITKAHANAKSAYVLNVNFNKKKNRITVKPVLKELDQSVAIDSNTNKVVQKWIDIANQNYASIGFDPKSIVVASGNPFEGRESYVRSQSTNLTKLITESMIFAAPQADIAIFNSGSVRVDDILYPPISQYDILRTLPFGGGIREADMKGRLLIKVLEAGRKNVGSGGFLQYSPAIYDATTTSWKIKNAAIDPNKTYRVALSDFLFTGREANLDFLNEKNPDIVKVYPVYASPDPRSDIRLAVVKFLTNNPSGGKNVKSGDQ